MMCAPPLFVLCIAAHLVFTVCAAAPSDSESKGTAAHGVLQRSLGHFQLAGNAQPTLREINGGRSCVNGFGKTPPGYYFKGHISLDQCAAIAHEQPVPLGFRWGRKGFDHGVYSNYAGSHSNSNGSLVDLGRLFPDPGDFHCTIYVALDGRGQPLAFVKSNISTSFDPKPKDGPAKRVCFQRWTMTEFFKPFVTELWFCYMPVDTVPGCAAEADSFYMQGKIFVVVFLFFLSVLGWIMADMPEFETPLVWFTRFLLSMEFGLLSCGLLLETWYDTESVTYFVLAFALNVIGCIIAFVPYWVMEHMSEDSMFNTAYLLMLAFSPCFLVEFMSYWSHFILLVAHQPLLIGMIAFLTSALASRYYQHVQERTAENGESIARRASLSSIDKASYVRRSRRLWRRY